MNVNEKYPYFFNRLIISVQNFIGVSIAFLLLLIIARIFEFALIYLTHQEILDFNKVTFQFIRYDILLFLNLSAVAAIPFILLGIFLDFRVVNFLMYFLVSLCTLVALILVFYFTQTLTPLGAEFLDYSNEDIRQTLGSSGALSYVNIIGAILLFFFFIYFSSRFTSVIWPTYVVVIFVIAIVAAPFLKKFMVPNAKSFAKVIHYQVGLNKLQYFSSSVYDKIGTRKSLAFDGFYFDDDYSALSIKYIDPDNYPFLYKDTVDNVLSPFFNKFASKPNIVFIIVEGLGRSYSGKNAELGSFTPFLDSLADHSLYWENFLSNGGRTFAALPSIFASAPFATNGFLELGEAMPKHQSLIRILKDNGYSANFYHGGDASFDNMSIFLKRQPTDLIVDKNSFGKNYKLMPAKENGFTWGYGDREVYQYYFDKKINKSPRLDIFLTLSTHNPFKILNQQKYLKMYEERLNELDIQGEGRTIYNTYKEMYSCVLYADDAIRYFINQYKKNPEFKNTIFVITGDHRMPEIPINTNIERFYVPLIIYSPMLSRTASFKGVSSQLDLTPTLLSFLAYDYDVQRPSVRAWVGANLDTSMFFNSTKFIPMMRNKTEFVDFVDRGIFYSKGQYSRINDQMLLSESDDKVTERLAEAKFAEFKRKNLKTFSTNKLIPDSVYYFTRNK